MNEDERRDEEAPSPAEERLLGLLLLLQTEQPDGARLPQSVARAARWQLVFRTFATTVGAIALAASEGLAMLVGGGRSRRS